MIYAIKIMENMIFCVLDKTTYHYIEKVNENGRK